MRYGFEPEARLEPAQAYVDCYCAICGGEIYRNEKHYRLFGRFVCSDCIEDAEVM